MANYDLTYEGSRVQNILDTGDELRDAGYIFRGEATPSTVPGTPTERVAYIGGPGTYTNFGGSITVGAGCICVFKYTGSAWSNQVINTGLSDAISSAINSEATTRSEADTALQNAINSEATTRSEADTALQNAITAINNNIGNGYVFAGVAIPSTSPVTGKVFYLAVQAGTYTNFEDSEETPLAVTAGINILKNTGTGWVLDQVIAIDAEPTQGSANLVKSGGVLNSIIQNGPAFDLSAYNAQGGVLATYADLSAALTALDALPADFKKGGMSIKFVLSSDNKYVQYRLMATSFSTTESDWQGVDDEPELNSNNLVKSGGTAESIETIKRTLFAVFTYKLNIDSNSYSIQFPLKKGITYNIQYSCSQTYGVNKYNILSDGNGNTLKGLTLSLGLNTYEGTYTSDNDYNSACLIFKDSKDAIISLTITANNSVQEQLDNIENDIDTINTSLSTISTFNEEVGRALFSRFNYKEAIDDYTLSIPFPLKKGYTYNISYSYSYAFKLNKYNRLSNGDYANTLIGLTMPANATSFNGSYTADADYPDACIYFKDSSGVTLNLSITSNDTVRNNIDNIDSEIEEIKDNLSKNVSEGINHALNRTSEIFTDGYYYLITANNNTLTPSTASSLSCICRRAFKGDTFTIKGRVPTTYSQHTYGFVGLDMAAVFRSGQIEGTFTYTCPSDGYIIVNSLTSYNPLLRQDYDLLEPLTKRDFLFINKYGLDLVASALGNVRNRTTMTSFGFTHFTDIHGDMYVVDDAYDISEYIKGTSMQTNTFPILNSGDICLNRPISGGVLSSEITEYMTKAVMYNIYHVLGQHEVGYVTRSDVDGVGYKKNNCLTHDEAYENWIEPMLNVWELDSVEEQRVINEKSCYYYKDFDDTRLICLYCYNIPLIDDEEDSTKYKYNRATVWFGQNQITWFINTLLSASDKKVIVMLHQTDKTIVSVGNEFFTSEVSGGNKIINGEIIIDIVQAFIDKSTINRTYYCSDTEKYPTQDFSLVVNADFSTLENSKFICYISGDSHVDSIGKISNSHQCALGFTASGMSSYDCVVRSGNYKESSIINAVGFHYSGNKGKLARIGQQSSIYMDDRRMCKFSLIPE